MSFFTLLKDLATKGIDKLLQTYKQTDNPALLHTLNIYKNLLNNPEQQELANHYASMDMFTDNSTMIANNKNLRSSSRQRINSGSGSNSNSNSNSNQIISQSFDIDNVFVNITKLYTEYDLIIMFNTLQLLIQNPQNYIEYTEGLNKLMEPINKQIQKWIVDNIVY